MWVLCLHSYVSATGLQCLRWPQEVRFLGTGVTDGYKLRYGCWELNPGPPEKHTVLLSTEPSVQPSATGLCLLSSILQKEVPGVLPLTSNPVLRRRTPTNSPKQMALGDQLIRGRSLKISEMGTSSARL